MDIFKWLTKAEMELESMRLYSSVCITPHMTISTTTHGANGLQSVGA